MPERGIDPFPSVAHIVLALQTIPGRVLSAMDSAVVSVTQIHGGDAWNVIPDSVVIRGTGRCFSPVVQNRVEGSLRKLCTSLPEAHGATAANLTCTRRYLPTVNSAVEASQAAHA